MKKSDPIHAAATGDLHIHDSSVNLWFDHVGVAGTKAYRAVRALLNRRGFKLGEDPNITKNYSCLNPMHRLGKKGDLEVAVTLSGRHIEVLFFQNKHNVENRNGGRFDFSKLERMPYLMQKQVLLERQKIIALAVSTTSLVVLPPRELRPRPEGFTNLEVIDQRTRDSGHFRPELGRCDWHGDYNRKTSDGQLLEQGSPVYFTDFKGRWMQGRAYYNLNNMWWVAHGSYGLANKGCFQLRMSRPEELRTKHNRKYSAERVNALIAKAVDKQDFLRAHQLKVARDAMAVPQ